MIKRIESFVAQYHMIEQNDVVVAGVSGGADSVCLLMVLKELQKKMSFSIEVVHVEHGIRGEQSKADAAYVEGLCRKLSLVCHRFDYSVPAYAKEHALSEEEAGRILRYQAFEEVANRYPHSKIAVAHNRNDQAETMLFHLVRGSSMQGLAGIAPVRGRIIRPLLQTDRAEIEAYLNEQGIEYCTDETNLSTDYARNKIRHKVLPVLSEVNAKALLHMEQAAEDIRSSEQYINQVLDEKECVYVRNREQKVWGIRTLLIQKEDVFLADRLIYRLLCRVAESSRDITRSHVQSVRELFSLQVGKCVHLPYRMEAVRTYEGVELMVRAKETMHRQEELDERPMQDLDSCRDFSCRIFSYEEKKMEIPKKTYTKWIDYDKIKDNLCVRTRQPGDYITIDDHGRTQKLKQFLINEKVPQKERDELLLVADKEHVVWIVGWRISAYYKVDGHTKRVLEIRFDGGNEENE